MYMCIHTVVAIIRWSACTVVQPHSQPHLHLQLVGAMIDDLCTESLQPIRCQCHWSLHMQGGAWEGACLSHTANCGLKDHTHMATTWQTDLNRTLTHDMFSYLSSPSPHSSLPVPSPSLPRCSCLCWSSTSVSLS